MKFALAMLVTVSLVGCSEDSTPRLPTPTSTPSSLTWLWAMVVDETGLCIAGATVEVVRGQGAGQRITQTTPCDAWAFDGGVVLTNLTPGVEMTLRASASGFAAQEKSVVPALGPQMAVLFAPSRIQ